MARRTLSQLALLEHILLSRGPENAMLEVEVRVIKRDAYGMALPDPSHESLALH